MGCPPKKMVVVEMLKQETTVTVWTDCQKMAVVEGWPLVEVGLYRQKPKLSSLTMRMLLKRRFINQ